MPSSYKKILSVIFKENWLHFPFLPISSGSTDISMWLLKQHRNWFWRNILTGFLFQSISQQLMTKSPPHLMTKSPSHSFAQSNPWLLTNQTQCKFLKPWHSRLKYPDCLWLQNTFLVFPSTFPRTQVNWAPLWFLDKLHIPRSLPFIHVLHPSPRCCLYLLKSKSHSPSSSTHSV